MNFLQHEILDKKRNTLGTHCFNGNPVTTLILIRFLIYHSKEQHFFKEYHQKCEY